MKHTRTFLSALVALGMALALVTPVSAQTTKEGAAKVVRIKGSARYSLGNNVWQPLKVGDVLRPGTTIQTDRESGSYVDVVLGDGRVPVGGGAIMPVTASTASGMSARPVAQQNTLRLFEDTVLGIDKLSAVETGAEMVTDTQLDLRSGHILGNVRKLSGASRYEVKLPNGVAGIRGTVYHLWADGRLLVATGTVVLSVVDSAGNTKTRVVNGGYEYNPRTDQIMQASPADIRSVETASTSVFATGTVFVNTVVQNPGQIITPISPDRTVSTDVSPVGGTPPTDTDE